LFDGEQVCCPCRGADGRAGMTARLAFA
jgi:hypothetical protein